MAAPTGAASEWGGLDDAVTLQLLAIEPPHNNQLGPT